MVLCISLALIILLFLDLPQHSPERLVNPPVLALLRGLLLLRHHPSQFFVRQSTDGRAQYRGQRNILHRIIDHRQHGQNRLHLHRIKIPASRLRIRRDPLLGQHVDKAFRPSADASQQDHHIPILRRTVTFLLLIPDPLPMDRICQLPRTGSNHFRLDLPAGVLRQFLVCISHDRFPCIRQQKFRFSTSLMVRTLCKYRAWVKSRILRVLHISQILRHSPVKDVVDTVQH